MIEIKRGLNLPIAGTPRQEIEDATPVTRVAVLGSDYPGLRPTMKVAEGDSVQIGTPLFEDKKNPGVVVTSPAAGKVASVVRGEKRALVAVVIDVEGDRSKLFETHGTQALGRLSAEDVTNVLRMSGLWTALRTRPYSKIPALGSVPNSIFVTAMDSNPLGVDAALVITERATEFALGLDVLAKLTEGQVHVCQKPGKFLPTGHESRVKVHEFDGPHPAGLPGTHIHFIDPVGPAKTVWYIGYQDVIAIGHLFHKGRIDPSRVVALGGPGVSNPRLLRTRLGADLIALTRGELNDGEQRIVSGSVLAGHTASGAMAFLGRYHNQVSVLPEERERRLFGYLEPGMDRHSVFPTVLSRWFGQGGVKFSTTSNGSPRAMVPIGTFEAVMPHDILPTQLLRSLLVGDLEMAIALGCLELDEEDIALCTYACPGKYEYGPVLRQMLTQIEKESA
ncbi:MAG: Na(+)-translocating NADH-quinone reductase subunit A [Pseudomonadales bacterium]|nr:Na(+)-translocating NADH-quinone reductase subunit A [Pseudomonadales bacterium]MCP5183835.1 Na(+)-translocating NADH-quinone reductase subunit A [Pseudomonadales bacterium]